MSGLDSEKVHYNQSLCEQAGGIYVHGYRKKDGTIVSSYCRDQKKLSEDRMFREGFMINEHDLKNLDEVKEAKEFGPDYQRVDVDFEIPEILEGYTDVPKSEYSDFTGLMIKSDNGGMKEVWGTRSSRPYSNTADYERLS